MGWSGFSETNSSKIRKEDSNLQNVGDLISNRKRSVYRTKTNGGWSGDTETYITTKPDVTERVGRPF